MQQPRQEVISILAISLNTYSVRLCESLDPQVVAEHRKTTYLGIRTTSWRYDCEIPDFIVPFIQRISQQKPTIVVVAFQEDVRPGSYLHSHLLPELLPQHGYKLYDRMNLMGIGRTSVTGIARADPFTRGLRLSVYIRSNVSEAIREVHKPLQYTNSIFQNKGAVAIYLGLPTGEQLAIINAHFPYNPKSVTESVQKKDHLIRDNAVFNQDIFFNEMYRQLVLDAPAKPTYVLLMGDLNYRIKPYQNWSAHATGQNLLQTLATSPTNYSLLLAQQDELMQQRARNNIYQLSEGVNNQGPQFAPTCKMVRPRPTDRVDIKSYRTGNIDQRVPSHCDRILYTTIRTGTGAQLTCIEYGRYDGGVTVKSDHAAVYGTFTFR